MDHIHAPVNAGIKTPQVSHVHARIKTQTEIKHFKCQSS